VFFIQDEAKQLIFPPIIRNGERPSNLRLLFLSLVRGTSREHRFLLPLIPYHQYEEQANNSTNQRPDRQDHAGMRLRAMYDANLFGELAIDAER